MKLSIQNIFQMRYALMLCIGMILSLTSTYAQCPDQGLTVSPSSATFCGPSSVNVTVALSQSGITYRLKDGGGTIISSDVVGTGGNIILTSSILGSSTIISVEAQNGASCTAFLTGTSSITIDTPITADPGSDDLSGNCGLTYALQGTNPVAGSGTWSLVSGPGTITSINANDPTSDVTVSLPGTYTFQWSVVNGTCSDSDQVIIVFTEPPVAEAGPNQSVCVNSATFAAVPSVGTGTWTLISGPGVPTYGNANSPTSSISVTMTGSYTFQWEEDNAGCTDADVVVIDFNSQPSSDAGSDDTSCGLSYSLNATASSGSGLWTQTSGPGTATFSNDINPNSNVSVTDYGTYVFQWAEDNGGCTDSDVVTIIFYEEPISDAGSGGNECDLNFTFSASSSVGTGTWTQVSGPGTPTFSNPNSPTSDVTVSTTGTYIFQWEENNNGCIDSDQVAVVFSTQPVADAGTNGNECDLDFDLQAIPSVGTGSWSFLSGPGTHAFVDASSATTEVTVSTPGTYVFLWTEINGICFDTDQVTVVFNTQPSADAGIGGSVCGFEYTFNATPSSGTGTWTQVSGPGISSFSNVNGPTATATVDAYGSYTFEWTEDNNGCIDAAQVTVDFFEQPTAAAGADDEVCDITYTLNATASVGSGLWTQVSGPGTASFDDNTSPTTDVTVSTVGNYTFAWTETNGPCSDSEQIAIEFREQPTADAGSGGNECDLDFNLNAVASVGLGTWTQVSGPGTSVFGNANNANTTVDVTTAGTYIFQWEETNGICSDSDQISVVFNIQPTADAGTSGESCNFEYTFSAIPSVGIGTWSVISGPGTASYDNPNSPSATATVTNYGTYVFQWSEDNGGCIDTDLVAITFTEQPVADAGTGGDECDMNFVFNATTSSGSGLWTQTSGPGAPSFSDATSSTSTVAVSDYGTYVFRWTETNGGCSDFDEITVNFYQQPVADAGSGGSECDLDFIFSAIPSVGIGTWSYVSGPGPVAFDDENNPTTRVEVSSYGSYVFQWTEDNNGCSSAQTVAVDFNELPTADAGINDVTCGFNYSLNPTPSVGVGLWSQVSGPSVASFTDVTDPFSDVSVSAEGDYVFRWSEDNSGCTDFDELTITFIEQPVANAGSGGDVCGDSYLFDALPSVLGSIGTWSVTSRPSIGATAIFNNPNSPNATVTVSENGTYVFTWTEVNNGCSDMASITVNFFEQPVADAGPGGEVCTTMASLAAVPSAGNGLWTKVSGPGTVIFSDTSSPSSTATVDAFGTYVFEWTEDNNGCVDSDQVTFIYNQQPVANAGIGGDVCGQEYLLSATPSVFGSIGLWTVTSSPAGGSASFNNANSPNATVSVNVYGQYEFTWTETNGSCSDQASVTVEYFEEPTVDAGSGGEVCNLNFTFSASSSVGTGTWTQVSGPGTTIFDDSNSATATTTVTTYGTYVYRWTEQNNTCEDFEEVTVIYSQEPTANAGTGGDTCGQEFTFNASPSVFGSIGQWTVVALPSGTANAVFNNPNSPNATVTVNEFGDYEFRWTETNGGCNDNDQITVGFYQEPVAEAGPVAEVCALNTNLAAVPSVGTGTWTQISGPGTATFVAPNDASSAVSVSNYGTYVFQWEEVNNVCSVADQVTITFNQQPVANAGTDDSVCDFEYLLSATPSVFGSIGQWTTTSTPTGSESATFNNPNSPTATVVVSGYGEYEFTWTETNGSCTDDAVVTIEFFETPVADAGPGGESCALTFGFNASPSVGIGTWTQVSGPGTSSFDDVNLATAMATVTAYGTYVYEWTENNSLCNDSEQVTVIYSEQPTANAGIGGDVCGQDYLLNAAPSVFGSIGIWTVESQPSPTANVTFNNANSPNATVTIDEYGTYEFRWTETNGACSDFASVIVNFYQEPVADAGFDGDACGLDYVLDATPSVGTGTWTLVNGPGLVSFSNENDPDATASVSVYGQYVFAWTENNMVCSDSEEITVRFTQEPLITSVDNQGAEYCEPASIVVSGTIGGGASAGNWSILSGGTGTLSASSLTGNVVSATYFPAAGEFGPVSFTLTTDDSDGAGPCVAATETLTIIVNESPIVDAGADFGVCEDEPFAQLNASFSGSVSTITWSGGAGTFLPNANDPNAEYHFDPSEIGTTVVLTLTSDDPDGSGPCTIVSDDVAVSINPLPVVNFFNLPNETNQGADPILLVGSQAGGTFSVSPNIPGALGSPGIQGVQDTVSFIPNNAAIGLNTITYVYTDPNGCTNTISYDVSVLPLTALQWDLQGSNPIAGGILQVCQDAGQLRLIGNPDPASGVFASFTVTPSSGLIVDEDPVLGWIVDTDNATPGDYEITYNYTDINGVPSTPLPKTVRVEGSPDVDFTVGATCITSAVEFTDMSTIEPGYMIDSLIWDFGDGNVAYNLTSVSNMYATNGAKDVTLTAIASEAQGKCRTSLTQIIEVVNEPIPDFISGSSCGDEPAEFINNTTLDGSDAITSFQWTFGDGFGVDQPANTIIPTGTNGDRTSGPIENPEHVYDADDIYNVTLRVTTNRGCVVDTVKNVNAVSLQIVDVNGFMGGEEDWQLPTFIPDTENSWRYENSPLGLEMWYTQGTDDTYFDDEDSYVGSPCFNIDALTKPMLAFDLFYEDLQEQRDGVVFQYSFDGVSWLNLGDSDRGINWFNTDGISSRPGDAFGGFNDGSKGWSGTVEETVNVRFNLNQIPASQKQRVQFRMAFASDGEISDGWVGFTNFYIGNKQREVVLETFADDDVPESTTSSEYVKGLRDSQRNAPAGYSDVTLLEYHVNVAGQPDEFNAFNEEDAKQRQIYYGVNQVPNIYLDGKYLEYSEIASENELDTIAFDRAGLVDPQFNIQIDPIDNPSETSVIRFNVQVTALEDMTDVPMQLHIAMVEDIAGGPDNIMRQLVLSDAGNSITGDWAEGTSRTYQGAWALGPDQDGGVRDPNAIRIMAFVQNGINRLVYQSAIVDAPAKSYGVITSLEDDLLPGQLKVFPNPATNYIKIQMPDDALGEYQYRLIDLRGVTIREGEVDRRFGDFVLDVSDIINGAYHLQILKSNQPVANRKLLIMK